MSRSPGATVGGQAVIEGVMMRAPNKWAVAVRRPDGVIEAVTSDLPRLSSRSRWAPRPLHSRGAGAGRVAQPGLPCPVLVGGQGRHRGGR